MNWPLAARLWVKNSQGSWFVQALTVAGKEYRYLWGDLTTTHRGLVRQLQSLTGGAGRIVELKDGRISWRLTRRHDVERMVQHLLPFAAPGEQLHLMTMLGATRPQCQVQMTPIGHYLQRLRLRKRLSRRQVALHLGCSVDIVLHWERGACTPPPARLSALAALYEEPSLVDVVEAWVGMRDKRC